MIWLTHWKLSAHGQNIRRVSIIDAQKQTIQKIKEETRRALFSLSNVSLTQIAKESPRIIHPKIATE
jgi:hypothetical protein